MDSMDEKVTMALEKERLEFKKAKHERQKMREMKKKEQLRALIDLQKEKLNLLKQIQISADLYRPISLVSLSDPA